MPYSSPIDWSALDATYTDEYGRIDTDVYAAAEIVWQKAQTYAQRLLAAESAQAHTLLMKAAAKVTETREAKKIEGKEIENLPAYLMRAFRNLVLDERQVSDNRERLHEIWRAREERREQLEWRIQAETVERRILFGEIAQMMDDWTRRVFQLRTLDYSFDQIAAEFGSQPEVVRNRFNRSLSRLNKSLHERSLHSRENYFRPK